VSSFETKKKAKTCLDVWREVKVEFPDQLKNSEFNLERANIKQTNYFKVLKEFLWGTTPHIGP
jgi:hypothetical protein